MREIVILLQIFIIGVSIVSLIQVGIKQSKNRKNSKKEFENLKEIGKVEEADDSYLEKVRKFYNLKKLSGGKLSHYDIHRTEIITTRSKYGSNTTYYYYIGNIRIILPNSIILEDLKFYEVEGIFAKDKLYVSRIDSRNLLEEVDAIEEGLKVYGEISKEDIALSKYPKKIIVGIILLIFAAIPFWEISYVFQIAVFILLSVVYFVRLKKDKRIMYKLNGKYERDEFGNERVGGVIVHSFDENARAHGQMKESYLAYEVGEEVEVIGEKINNELFLKRYKGFDYIKHYISARKYYYRTNFFFAIGILVITVFFYNMSGIKRYFEYAKVKDKDFEYSSLESLKDDLVEKQYVTFNNFYLYPTTSQINGGSEREYYLIEKEKYIRGQKSLEEEMKAVKKLEEEVKSYIDNIDWVLLYSDYKIQEFGQEEYKKLKELYFKKGVDQTELLNQFYKFKDLLYDKVNEEIKEVEKKLAATFESKVIIKDIYLYRNNTYYTIENGYSGDSTSVFRAYDGERLYGTVRNISNEGDKFVISFIEGATYSRVADKSYLIYIILMYISFSILALGMGVVEVIKMKKINE